MHPAWTGIGRAATLALVALVLVGCGDDGSSSCSSAEECPRPVTCAVPTCFANTCGAAPDDSRCGAGQRCDVTSGCIPADPPEDAHVADAAPDGPVAPTCNDGMKNASETGIDCGGRDCPPCPNGAACDVGSDCMTDFCDTTALRCRFARSCLELRELGVIEDGTYALDPDGESDAFQSFFVFCDMTTEGGGWTEITPALARHELNGALVGIEPATEQLFEAGDQPCTRDASGNHAYHYTFDFAAGYSEFFLDGFALRAFAGESETSELDGTSFTQSSWEDAHGSSSGDVSFGSPFADGPVTSFAAELDTSIACGDCVVDWPAQERVFSLGSSETSFRIGWGEAGADAEGWCPWWQGTIRLR